MIRDHFGTMLRAFSKPAGEELIIGTDFSSVGGTIAGQGLESIPFMGERGFYHCDPMGV